MLHAWLTCCIWRFCPRLQHCACLVDAFSTQHSVHCSGGYNLVLQSVKFCETAFQAESMGTHPVVLIQFMLSGHVARCLDSDRVMLLQLDQCQLSWRQCRMVLLKVSLQANCIQCFMVHLLLHQRLSRLTCAGGVALMGACIN